MTGLIPFNLRNTGLVRTGAGFEDFYNMIDDFFSSGTTGRNLLRDSFKIDVVEKEKEYIVEAELPGTKKEEIDLNIDEDTLCISVNHTEETAKDDKNYIHKERRATSMNRRIRLSDTKLDEISAKLEDGVLTITIPKDIKVASSRKIDIK